MADLTPLTLITGLPGSGKSLFTLATVAAYAKAENRPVYYHGIPELTLGWQILDNPVEWHKLPNGSIIVIDESQSTFPPRGSSAAMPSHVAAANTLRHSGFNLVLITQHPMLIDNSIRKLVTRHYHVVRFYGFEKSTIHEFNQVRDNCDKSLKGSIANHFVYPKEVFTWYKSADRHTIKKRIPARLILIIVLPILIVFALFFGLKQISGLSDSAKIASMATADIQPGQKFDNQKNAVVPTISYPEFFVPRLSDLPYTAIRYDEVTKPITAPFPASCIASKSRCLCHTQQGTRLHIGDKSCRFFAENGFFRDFADPSDQKQQVAGL